MFDHWTGPVQYESRLKAAGPHHAMPKGLMAEVLQKQLGVVRLWHACLFLRPSDVTFKLLLNRTLNLCIGLFGKLCSVESTKVKRYHARSVPTPLTKAAKEAVR